MGSAGQKPRKKRRRLRKLKNMPYNGDTFAPFGDVSPWGGPLPTEMPYGFAWHTERWRMIRWLRMLVAVVIGVAVVMALAVVGAVVDSL